MTEHSGGSHVLITLGADVEGRDGKLGSVSRVIVHEDAVTNVVVKKRSFGATEYVVPVGDFTEDTGGALRLDLAEDQLEQFDLFDSNAYRAPDPDYTGPPGFDASSAGQRNLQLDSYVAMGPTVGLGGGSPVLGFPGGERRASRQQQMQWSSISEGSQVVDSEGEKVGEVDELTLGADGNQPERLVLRSGLFGRTKSELPVDWIDSLEDEMVILSVPKREVEALSSR